MSDHITKQALPQLGKNESITPFQPFSFEKKKKKKKKAAHKCARTQSYRIMFLLQSMGEREIVSKMEHDVVTLSSQEKGPSFLYPGHPSVVWPVGV